MDPMSLLIGNFQKRFDIGRLEFRERTMQGDESGDIILFRDLFEDFRID